jgi:uncharacterized membrane protein
MMAYVEDALVGLFNAIGHLVCHQVPARTLWVGGQYLPVCARDTGAYLGFYIGYLLLPLRNKDARGPPNLWMTLLMVAPLIVDAATQLAGLRTSTNELRLVTGLVFGAALAPLLVYLLGQIPTSRRLPILRTFLPIDVDLDDRSSWLNPQALGLGLLIAVTSFVLVHLAVGSTDPLFYWMLSAPITVSIVLHVFVLPIFLVLSFAIYLKERCYS